VPISYSGRTYEEGKKIGWRDGLAAIFHILQLNLVSPKAGRRPFDAPAKAQIAVPELAMPFRERRSS
jgi:hypothetical protein